MTNMIMCQIIACIYNVYIFLIVPNQIFIFLSFLQQTHISIEVREYKTVFFLIAFHILKDFLCKFKIDLEFSNVFSE